MPTNGQPGNREAVFAVEDRLRGVAPVYLKAVHRIQALLCVYFFTLLVEATFGA